MVLNLQLILAGLAQSNEGEGQQPKISQPAPLFELVSLDGDTLALAKLRGKFVVIHFAASW
jgi:peroxiredoxin